ncbi:MAG: NUDIX domain-containing protein [Desulfosoma sp.]|uniref:NUDIX domain-containing protein n=1 Tax=Desulfosoma sp. TaxID=2603217 RepID=UPI00404A7076
MKAHIVRCPRCGAEVARYRQPALTVDVIIHPREAPGSVVLIRRRNPPLGWALPGGFVDEGESLERAAQREAKEETGLDLERLRQFRAYSEPERDPRRHTVTVVFSATGIGRAHAADDAQDLRIFPLGALPDDMAFDHRRILEDYIREALGSVVPS